MSDVLLTDLVLCSSLVSVAGIMFLAKAPHVRIKLELPQVKILIEATETPSELPKLRDS